MSEKNRDSKGRWRNRTVAFRMSPEEKELLIHQVKLSGLTEQDYIIQCLLNHQVVIRGTPRVVWAIREDIKMLLEELRRSDRFEADDIMTGILDRLVTVCAGFQLNNPENKNGTTAKHDGNQ